MAAGNPDLSRLLKLSRPAPPLPAPTGQVRRVTTSAELLDAITSAPPATTILLADGRYTLPPNTVVKQDRLALRGESGDREKVILDGGDRQACMLVIKGADDLLIADLTMANSRLYGIYILADSDVQRPQIYNVKFHNIWTRAVKGTDPRRPDDRPQPLHPVEYGKRVRPAGGAIRHCLFLCDTVKPHDDLFGGNYISGIDAQWLRDWTIADNVFAGIRGRTGGGRGAIFIWVESENVVAERNLIINCDRGICFGNPSSEPWNMDGGIVRNNFIVGGANMAIEMDFARNTIVCNNSVFATRFDFGSTLHFARSDTGVRCINNLVHGEVNVPVDVDQRCNRIGAIEEFFADAACGDLHLTPHAAGALRKGLPLPEVTGDFDARPRRSPPNLGADDSEPRATST